MLKHSRREKGFTLIELMIVVVIIGILAAMAIPRFFAATTKAKQSEARSILKQVYTMQLGYRNQYDAYWGAGSPTAFGSTAAGRAGFAALGVDVETSSRYTYNMTVASATAFTCTATCSNLDDDLTVDVCQIDNFGDLVCTTDDSAL